jgi:hypothetical protein
MEWTSSDFLHYRAPPLPASITEISLDAIRSEEYSITPRRIVSAVSSRLPYLLREQFHHF